MFFKKSLLAIITLSSLVSLSATSATVVPPNQNQQKIILTGTISAVSCEVILNGGQSTINVGNFPSANFKANEQLGSTALNIALTGCDKASSPGKGNLLVSGTASSANTELFVSNSQDTVGFMLRDEKQNQITPNTYVPLDVAAGDNNYTLSVGIGSLTVAPANGVYSAPIMIAYLSD